MPRRYRAYGQGQWCAASGNAALALYNPLDSNKAIYVHAVEVHNVTRSAAATATSFAAFAVAVGATSGGDAVPTARYDTNVSATAGVSVLRDAQWTSTALVMPWIQYKKWTPAAVAPFAAHACTRGRLSMAKALNAVLAPPRDAAVEPITVRPGESAGLYVTNLNSSQVYQATLRYKVVGAEGAGVTQHVRAIADGCGPLVLRNDSASDVVQVLDIDVSEIGTFDSPYFQLAPVLLDPQALADLTKRVPVAKYDTADAAFAGVLISDAAVAPAGGIPVSYLSDASAGSPKGFNYLGTKDFIGPAYRLLFPETAGIGTGAGTLGSRNLLGLNNRRGNLLATREAEPIVLRPGEAIGLTSAAELATAATAVPVSGWSSFDFALTMSVQDLVVPTIQLTGLQTGTRVALVEAGTETLVDIDDESGGVYTYTFDASPGDFVDINIACPGYVFQVVSGIELVSAVQSIPIEQVADLIYDAGAAAAVTFDGATKRIVCDAATTAVAAAGLYSDWIDWTLSANNLRFLKAFETVGGNDLGGGISITPYYFLQNGWRVRPQEANHTLAIAGNLTVAGGGDPVVSTIGNYRVLVRVDFALKSETVATSGSSLSAADVWSYGMRTLTSGGAGGGDWTSEEKEQIRYRLGLDGTAAGPTATPDLALSADVATLLARLTAPRAANLDNVDAAVSTRLATAGYTAPNNAGIAVAAAEAEVAADAAVAAAAGVAAVKAATDQLSFTVANRVDVNVRLMNSAAVLGNGTAGDLWRG